MSAAGVDFACHYRSASESGLQVSIRALRISVGKVDFGRPCLLEIAMDMWMKSLAVGAIWGLGVLCLGLAVIRRSTAWFIAGQVAFCLCSGIARIMQE
jgi:hypothetical protein